MTGLLLVPVILSLLVLAAHVLRAGMLALVLLVLGITALLAVPRPWAARTVQATLVLGALEWLRTLVVLAEQRIHDGSPVLRLVAILAVVAAWTALSALAFRTGRLRRRYGLGERA